MGRVWIQFNFPRFAWRDEKPAPFTKGVKDAAPGGYSRTKWYHPLRL
jgi:hypothetical protein